MCLFYILFIIKARQSFHIQGEAKLVPMLGKTENDSSSDAGKNGFQRMRSKYVIRFGKTSTDLSAASKRAFFQLQTNINRV